MARAKPKLLDVKAVLEPDPGYVELHGRIEFASWSAQTLSNMQKRYNDSPKEMEAAWRRHLYAAAENFVYQSQMHDYL